MANSWGESGTTWGQGDWGQQDVTTVHPTGFSITSTLGDAQSYPEEGWGRDAWGDENWGDSNLTLPVTGFSITATLGDLAYAASIAGWGRDTWGENDWGDSSLTIVPTGYAITGSLGIPGAASEQGWGRETWGNEPWGDSNSPVISVTGFSITATLGTLAYAAAEDGWGRDSWGENDWGDSSLTVITSSFSMTSSLGVPDVYPEQGWGRQTWGSEAWGDSNNPSFAVGGFSITAALGTLPYAASEEGWGRDEWGYGNWGENTTTVIVDGFEISTGLGEQGWGRSTWGSDAWGQGNTVNTAIVHPITGFGITASLGTSTVNHDFIFTLPDSFLLTAHRGSISINNGADHTQGLGGLAATMSLGTVEVADVVFGPQSFLATMSLGAAAAGDVQRVSVTGYGITASQGSIGSIDDMTVGSGSFAITGSLGSLTITDMQVGVSGFEITGTFGSGGVAPLGYKDVDITGNTSYTYVKHAGE